MKGLFDLPSDLESEVESKSGKWRCGRNEKVIISPKAEKIMAQMTASQKKAARCFGKILSQSHFKKDGLPRCTVCHLVNYMINGEHATEKTYHPISARFQELGELGFLVKVNS